MDIDELRAEQEAKDAARVAELLEEWGEENAEKLAAPALIAPELTKASIEAAGIEYAGKLLDAGEEEILIVYLKMRALKDALDFALKELQSEAMDEAQLHLDGNENTRMGVKFALRSGRELWTFGHDEAWNELKQSERDAAEARKRREGFLKALEKEMVDPATGEFIKPAILTGYARSSFAITFPKS